MKIYYVEIINSALTDKHIAFVCYAKDESNARRLYPQDNSIKVINGKWRYKSNCGIISFLKLNKPVPIDKLIVDGYISADNIHTLRATYLGEAPYDIKEEGVIGATYNY
jgi:hypothetical protein